MTQSDHNPRQVADQAFQESLDQLQEVLGNQDLSSTEDLADEDLEDLSELEAEIEQHLRGSQFPNPE